MSVHEVAHTVNENETTTHQPGQQKCPSVFVVVAHFFSPSFPSIPEYSLRTLQSDFRARQDTESICWVWIRAGIIQVAEEQNRLEISFTTPPQQYIHVLLKKRKECGDKGRRERICKEDQKFAWACAGKKNSRQRTSAHVWCNFRWQNTHSYVE